MTVRIDWKKLAMIKADVVGLPPCDPADFIPPWPCQQLHGGRPPYIYQGCDPDTGLCHHEECNPANDDRMPNAEHEPRRGTSRSAPCSCSQSGSEGS